VQVIAPASRPRAIGLRSEAPSTSRRLASGMTSGAQTTPRPNMSSMPRSYPSSSRPSGRDKAMSRSFQFSMILTFIRRTYHRYSAAVEGPCQANLLHKMSGGICTRGRRANKAHFRLARDLRAKLEAAAAAHQAERAKLNERQTAHEARWLIEVDRARQAVKETTKDHERQSKDWRSQLTQLQAKHDEVKKELLTVRSELRIARSLQSQMEKRLAAIIAKSDNGADLSNPSRQPRLKFQRGSARHDPHRGGATHDHARTPRHLGARRYRRLDHAALDALLSRTP
jgi:hypothetical protein